MKKYLLLLSVCFALTSFAQDVKISKAIKQAMDRIDTNIIRSHIAYLADDKLKGRLPGTEGYQTAVDYVVDKFKQIGISPGGDNGGYTQKLVIRKSTLVNNSAVTVLKDNAGNTDTLKFEKDFTAAPHPLRANSSAEGRLVFVGYGIDIPGGYSDYTGIDVKGKIVVLVFGAFDGLHSTLSSHYNNTGNKLTTAFNKGAVGAIIIGPQSTGTSNVTLNTEKTTVYGRGFVGNLPVVLHAGRATLSRLFFNSGKNLDKVRAEIKKGNPSSFELPYSLTVSYKTSHNDFESYNVVGLIPGSDPVLKNEYVVHSAHLDHVGIGRVQNGDSIYNGAHDNASGVASLLEISRVYKTSSAKPKRSILIVMMTGEEMGLIG